MNLDRVCSGDNIPDEINVIIEIPAHSDPVKYEVDKETVSPCTKTHRSNRTSNKDSFKLQVMSSKFLT